MTNTRTIGQRQRLCHRSKPYWHKIDGLLGASLGFRKYAARALQGGGSWILRYRVGGKYFEHAFAESDNAKMPSNESTVLSFDEAINRARALYSELTSDEALRKRKAHFTVRDCCREYVKELEDSGGGWQDASRRLDAFVTPELGDALVEDLTAETIREWMRTLAKQPPRARPAMNGRIKRYRTVDESDPDYRRKRAATVNRIWTSLRAALNLAYQRDRFQSVEFQKVKPLKFGRESVNKAHCRPILPEEMDGFLEAARLQGEDFERLVIVACCSGLRYGELCRLRVGDYDRENGTLYVLPGKTGRDRIVHVIQAGRELLAELTEGREPDAPLLTHANGSRWGKSHQTRPWRRAAIRSGIKDSSFKSTRDTYGTWLLAAGVRLIVVSKQLGHASVAMTEKHYVAVLETLRHEELEKTKRIRLVGGAKILKLKPPRGVRERRGRYFASTSQRCLLAQAI